jgi:hypothetical protein
LPLCYPGVLYALIHNATGSTRLSRCAGTKAPGAPRGPSEALLRSGQATRITRITVRRFTWLTNAFSKKIENHCAAVALGYFAYNFIKVHRTLRMTPAMAAGVASRLWDAMDLAAAFGESRRSGKGERPENL